MLAQLTIIDTTIVSISIEPIWTSLRVILSSISAWIVALVEAFEYHICV